MHLPNERWIELGRGSDADIVGRLALGLRLGAGYTRSRWRRVAALLSRCAIVTEHRGEPNYPPGTRYHWTLVWDRPATDATATCYARQARLASALAEFAAEEPPAFGVDLTVVVDDERYVLVVGPDRRWFSVDLLSDYRTRADAAPAEGLRYRERLVVGSKVRASVAMMGGVKPGAVGIVYEVYDRSGREGESEGYGIIFGSGDYDGFSPDDIDNFVELTGEVAEAYRSYHFANVGRLARDFGDPSAFFLAADAPLQHVLRNSADLDGSRYSW